MDWRSEVNTNLGKEENWIHRGSRDVTVRTVRSVHPLSVQRGIEGFSWDQRGLKFVTSGEFFFLFRVLYILVHTNWGGAKWVGARSDAGSGPAPSSREDAQKASTLGNVQVAKVTFSQDDNTQGWALMSYFLVHTPPRPSDLAEMILRPTLWTAFRAHRVGRCMMPRSS